LDNQPNSTDLRNLYLKAVVTVEENGHFVTASDSSLVARGPVHVITAWNPGALRPSPAENKIGNEQVFEILLGRGLDPVKAIGADPDSNHFEESWAVVGLTDDEARMIGAQFGQVAVFRLTANEQAVLGCIADWTMSRPT